MGNFGTIRGQPRGTPRSAVDAGGAARRSERALGTERAPRGAKSATAGGSLAGVRSDTAVRAAAAVEGLRHSAAALRPSNAAASGAATGRRSVTPLDLGAEVRAALLDYHRDLIATNPAGVRDKLAKIAASPFAFFRGTADLFYHDLTGTDAALPTVLCDGDVHPENFGVIVMNDGTLAFALNDFDEAAAAPFSWDLKRGATAFALAARECPYGADGEAYARAFIESYFAALACIAQGKKPELVRDPPKVITTLLADAESKERTKFLKKRVDLDSGQFIPSAEIEPHHELVRVFEKVVLAHWRDSLPKGAVSDDVKVLDVARKFDSGTASVGMDRYYVHARIGGKSFILEVKEERRSVMAPHLGDVAARGSEAERVVAAERKLIDGGDRFYGATDYDGKSFIVRERSPHKLGVELATLSADELRDYARACGAALAMAHGLAGGKGKVATQILRATKTREIVDETVRFAGREADRVSAQYDCFATQWRAAQAAGRDWLSAA